MSLFTSNRRKLYMAAGGIFIVVLAAAGVLYSIEFLSPRHPKELKIVAKDFQPGTKVSYEVFSKGRLLGTGKEEINKEGSLELGALQNNPEIKTQENLTYKIAIEKANIDALMDVTNPMNVVLNVNQKQKAVTFEGSGFPEFSNVLVTSGDETKASKTDWAGMFNESSSPLQNPAVAGQANEMVKIAFQNLNLGTDAAAFNPNGTIEVFFGDPDGSSTAAVNARYGHALMLVTEQLSAVMMQQALIIGTLLDAKMQLETQRKLQELQARAHKDYHPSDQMCRFGTFVRSIADSESKAEMDKHALNRYLMDQYLGVQNSSSALGQAVSGRSRLDKFVTAYCDPYDNNGGLKLLCSSHIGPTTPEQRNRFNKDVDFTRTLDNKLTLNINFVDGTPTTDEEDIVALAHNLYLPQVFEEIDEDFVKFDTRSHYYSRIFAAKMSVAHNSFVSIVGMKSSAPIGHPTKNPLPDPPQQMRNPRGPIPPVPNYTEDAGWTYMKAMMRELGIADKNNSGNSDDEIHALLGERPSYYAQMDVLMKKIYQTPDFYTNLYDKPTNVDRIGAAMDAISIMNQRDRYESLTRQEMLTALLVEENLSPQVEELNSRIFTAIQASSITRSQP